MRRPVRPSTGTDLQARLCYVYNRCKVIERAYASGSPPQPVDMKELASLIAATALILNKHLDTGER